MMVTSQQSLLIDADDTLWENHAYFLEVLAAFLDLMEERGHRREQVLHTIRGLELHRTAGRGYGSGNFARSLVDTVTFYEGTVSPGLQDELHGWGRWIHDHPVEVFPGVAGTLEALGLRHELYLVTKGDRLEQAGKLERSGLSRWFQAVEILPEKDVNGYRSLVDRHGLPGSATWMVGNSPRSDILPARDAGLRTVYIPHRTLPEFEAAPLEHPPDLTLRRFRELARHF